MRDLAPCCVCGSSQRTIRFAETPQTVREPGPYGGHYQINRCNGCGLIYSSPIFDEQEVKDLYTGYSEANVAEGEVANVRATMRGYYALGRAFVPQKQRALDIGCDIGLMLDVLREDGFAELDGLEPVARVRARAAALVPAATISGTFYEDAEFPKNYFDMVTLIHVLDHMIRPDRALGRVYGDLRPGGICIAVVHDIESPLARLMGARFPILNYFHHYFFSKKTLRKLFAARGFEILRVTATRNRYSLAFFIERAPFLAPRWRQALSRLSRRLAVGHVALSIPVGNIGIVARKPATAGG